MTNWLPDISAYDGPHYRRLTDALARDIERGALRAGERLPAQRDLAYDLGLSLGTVTRAYREAVRRGLIAAEVGRGSYVLGTGKAEQGVGDGFVRHPPPTRNEINLSLTRPVNPNFDRMLREALQNLGGADDIGDLISYGPAEGLARHRMAATHWFTRFGINIDPDSILLTHGAQNAITVAVTTVLQPGESIVAEALTYAGFKALSATFGADLIGVDTDHDAARPDAFDTLCRTRRVRAVYLMPTHHNPTMITQSLERRRALVDIARRHDVLIIEDDTYGFLGGSTLPRIVTLAPERTVYLSSVSKFLPPSLRIGFIAAPARLLPRLQANMRSMNWMASPISAEIITRWIADGTADDAMQWQIDEGTRRLALVRRYFDLPVGDDCTASMHAWLPLPEPWRASDFVIEAHRRGIAMTSADAFAVSRNATPHAIRFGLGADSLTELELALQTISELIRQPAQPGAMVV